MKFPVDGVRGPLPRRPSRNEARALLTSFRGRAPLPLAGIRADDARSRLPTRDAQWHTRMLNWNTRWGSNCKRELQSTKCKANAVAYRCGGSAGSRVQVNGAPCFPFNCTRNELRARAPECGQCMSGLGASQECGSRQRSFGQEQSIVRRDLSHTSTFSSSVEKSLHKAVLLRLETRQMSERAAFRAKMRGL